MPHVNALSRIVLLVASLSGLPAGSSPLHDGEVATTPPNTFGRMEALHARNLALQAELQGAELSRSLSAARAPADTLPDDRAAAPGQPSSGRHQVLSITGRDSQLLASVRLRDGRVVTLRRGSPLPDTRLTVTALGVDGVTLSDGSLITF